MPVRSELPGYSSSGFWREKEEEGEEGRDEGTMRRTKRMATLSFALSMCVSTLPTYPGVLNLPSAYTSRGGEEEYFLSESWMLQVLASIVILRTIQYRPWVVRLVNPVEYLFKIPSSTFTSYLVCIFEAEF